MQSKLEESESLWRMGDVVVLQTEKRTSKSEKYTENQRMKFSVAAALGVPISLVGEIYSIFSANDNLETLQKGPSKNTTALSLIELHECFLNQSAFIMSESDDLNLCIDTTTDGQRNMMAISFGGKLHDDRWWTRPYSIIEIREHDAQTLLNVVIEVLKDIKARQRNLNKPQTVIYNFKSITADNASVNKLFHEKMNVLIAIEWEKDKKEGAPPSILFKGCDDHIANLASKEFERR